MKVYINWFLINFVICLLPLAFSSLIIWGISDNIISSFIAFSFTSLVISFYIYDRDSKLESPLKWSSLLLILVLLFLYVYYPALINPELKDLVKDNIWYFLSIMFLLTLIFSLLLNKSAIREIIRREKSTAKFQKVKEDKKSYQDMIDKLKGGEKNEQ